MHYKIKLSISLLLILTILSFFLIPFSFSKESSYVWSTDLETTLTNASPQEEKSSLPLNLESASAILIEQTTGQILYEHNAHEPLRPASVTKVMSILLIMEALNQRKNHFK